MGKPSLTHLVFVYRTVTCHVYFSFSYISGWRVRLHHLSELHTSLW